MKVSELEPLRSFALLGPGFGGDGFSLLTGLRAASDGPLILAPFEIAGREALRYAGEVELRSVQVELERPHRALAPTLQVTEQDYTRTVESIRSDIAAGDVYQVCLTTRARIGVCTGAELFSALCARGVPRFAAWVRLPDGGEFVSASPELLLEVDGARVRSEPMKGTAAPGDAQALVQSSKDAAELAMIVDLVRNDLSRVCLPRTVRVSCERRIVELPYALQTVADVEGTLPAHSTMMDALDALHPGGSVTGAPKLAALDRIRRLEPGPRGAYCGALGFVRGECATFALLIRTAQKIGAEWIYGVGSGIVYDSEPARELQELHVKLGAVR